ncbi:helix-turn-helix transcriptional regulator [Streptomyces sp. DSM 40473]|uniref:Helix-turn-helix transcriptional regulator n=1 Tax=Streptomyces hesseae TaxID=3075519 RepID=A0ABU2SSQ2_9ACTN|nr:helix-turn-helix transcriptional regulator [Streptomyces sp. DSM 40473]MDT0452023.1 helix-turn-helix transcriptional regulator [Streptomyces sp. DSM 40473]
MRRDGSGGAGATTAAVFGEVLRHHREVAGLTQGDLAVKIPCDRSLVARVETGTRVPQRRFVLACDRELGTGEMFAKLWRKIDWYPEVSHPDWFKRRAEMDAQAVAIRTYQGQVIPGLLQTEEYARALFSRSVPGDEKEVEERLRARMSRQQRFLDPDGPLLIAVLDESSIRTMMSDDAVMRNQCAHLLAMGQRPNVCIQVAPAHDGRIIRPDTSMSLITLPNGEVWVYSESLDNGHFNRDPAVIARHAQTYDVLRADALSARDSAALIRDAMEGYAHDDCMAQEQPQRGQCRRLHRNSPRYPRLRPRKGQ